MLRYLVGREGGGIALWPRLSGSASHFACSAVVMLTNPCSPFFVWWLRGSELSVAGSPSREDARPGSGHALQGRRSQRASPFSSSSARPHCVGARCAPRLRTNSVRPSPMLHALFEHRRFGVAVVASRVGHDQVRPPHPSTSSGSPPNIADAARDRRFMARWKSRSLTLRAQPPSRCLPASSRSPP
jgi:hypothetical protein